MGWGLDARWSALAAERGWPIGVVDATPSATCARSPATTRATPRSPRPRRSSTAARTSPATQAAETLAEHRALLMRVAIVAEYYPRARDPALGVWAHRQALAARDAGADVRCSCCTARCRRGRRCAPATRARSLAPLRQPLRAELDGIRSPTSRSSRRRGRARTARGAPGRRRRSRSRCGACGARSRSISSTRTTRRPPATPCGGAAGAPLVVSVHGGDVLARRAALARRARRRPGALARARGSCSRTRRRSRARAARSARAHARRAPRHRRPAERRRATAPAS